MVNPRCPILFPRTSGRVAIPILFIPWPRQCTQWPPPWEDTCDNEDVMWGRKWKKTNEHYGNIMEISYHMDISMEISYLELMNN